MQFDLVTYWSSILFNASLYIVLVLVQRHIDVWLPIRRFEPRNRRYRSFRWERNGDFYRDVLKIARWKDKLPCLEGLTRFSKKNLQDTRSEYMRRFVIETCRAESNHWTLVMWVAAMKLWTPVAPWLFCISTAFLGNLPFICIQRYNRPRLQRTLAQIEQRRIARGYRPRIIEAQTDDQATQSNSTRSYAI